MDIRKLQLSLAALGFDPGPIDGLWGRRTSAALQHFQESAGLGVTGLPNAETEAELKRRTGGVADTSSLVWYEEARRLKGVRESRTGSNPVILDWAKNLDIAYPNDDIPWCGLFVAHCIGYTLRQEPLPSDPLAARAWKKFGQQVEPQLGAVLVFWRESKQSYKGHVGFYESEDDEAYNVLGGNQSDSVSVARIAKYRLLDARWPVSAANLATGARLRASGAGALSQNEA